VTVTGADVSKPSKYASGLRCLILQTEQSHDYEIQPTCHEQHIPFRRIYLHGNPRTT